MSIKCLFGHKWNGCKCERCGEVKHLWKNENGCICAKCGETRNEGEHDWKPLKGRWHDECAGCGKKQKCCFKLIQGRGSEKLFNAGCMDDKDFKVIDDALTFLMNASTNANTVNECSKLMAKLQHDPVLLTRGDVELAMAALIRYCESIPELVEVNPAYAAHKKELLEDRKYISMFPMYEFGRLLN